MTIEPGMTGLSMTRVRFMPEDEPSILSCGLTNPRPSAVPL